MPVRIDEHARVSAPEGLGAMARYPRAGRLRLRDHTIDFLGRAHVVRERDAAPPAAVVRAAVLGEETPVPEGDDHPACLEEDHFVVRLRPRHPPERLVERARPPEVADAE